MRHPLSAFLFSFVFSLSASWPTLSETVSFESPQDVRTVLASVQRSHELISNVRIESSWNCRFQGMPDTWEDQTLTWDDLGRRRLKTQVGSISNTGKRLPNDEVYVTETIYNGEVVAYSQFYPNRNRVGFATSVAASSGYNPVIIGDSSAPLRKELEGHRNPFEYIRNVAIRDLNVATKANLASIAPAGPNGSINVRVEYAKTPDAVRAYSIIAIDPKKNWSIESLVSYDAEGNQTQEIIYEYEKQADGLWVPKKGHHQRWEGGRDKGVEAFHWSFDVQKVVYNDPDFNEDVFDIKLGADAAVSDTRYDVAYRIGDKEAFSSDLENLADAARKLADEKEAALKKGNEFVPKRSRWRSTFLLVNAVILMSVIGIYFYRRSSSTA